MSNIPRPSGKEMVRFLERQGFAVIRGSHHFMELAPHRTSMPVHGNRSLKTGTLHGILRDIEMSTAEFEQRWNA